MIRDLASLLAPMSEQTFIEHFLEKKRLHISSKNPERTAQLLPWATINQLIECDILPPERFRVIRSAIDIAPQMFRRQDGSKRLRAGVLQTLLQQGTSLIINEIDDLVPQIRNLTDAIERGLAHRVGVNCYVSFGRGSAFKAHWDNHDVLVVQVHGSKLWRSYGTPNPFPVEKRHRDPVLPTEIVWEGLMEPGDLLYLPRGEVHDAALEGKNSVHLTIGITARRGLDLLDWLADQATDDELLRMDLTRLGGEAALQRQETRLKERLHALIDTVSLAAYLDSDDLERTPRTLLSIGQDDRLGEDTFIVPAPRRRTPLATKDEGEVAVTIGAEQHRLSATARRALSLLLERNGLRFGEFPPALGALDREESLRKGVLELVKHGLAALEWRALP
jgi:ribosomal protein L16 Arg81 hydroxylase